MKCPFCESSLNIVTDSRPTKLWNRRMRECETCGRRFSTIERACVYKRGAAPSNSRISPIKGYYSPFNNERDAELAFDSLLFE